MSAQLLCTFLSHYQERTNQQLAALIFSKSTNNPTQQATLSTNSSNLLVEAMNYSLVNGGKRIRPILVYAAALATRGGTTENYTPTATEDAFAVAIELVHSYSLIHDDLPAMDDDDLRRGLPTCHIQFDEATAILAGDALQCFAFEHICTHSNTTASIALEAIALLSNSAGASGMVMGQAIDLAAVDKQLDIEQLERMHNLKTGALIEAAVGLGAIANQATISQRDALHAYARAIGLAFQVHDDILDVTANTSELGKPQGSDQERNKPTYVSLLGLEGAQIKAKALCAEAHLSLRSFGSEADTLRQIATYIIERRN